MAMRSSKLVRRAVRERSKRIQKLWPAPIGADVFPFHSTAELWLTGSFEAGGYVIVRDAEHEIKLKLKPVSFAVLAILIMAARRAAVRKPWSASGFIPAEHFAAEFTRWSSTADRKLVIKYVHFLRRDFTAVWRKQTGSPSAKQWAFDLIETDQCGYRLSIEPRRMHWDPVLPRPLKIPPAESKKNSFAIFLESPSGPNSIRD